MRYRQVGLLAVFLILATACSALAMGGRHGKGDPRKPISVRGWPQGVRELVNRENRTGGYWINASDWFFFTGDTAAFNAFLAQYAALKDTPLRLVRRRDRDSATAAWPGLKPPPFDWQVSVTDTPPIQDAPLRSVPVQDLPSPAAFEPGLPGQTRFHVTISLPPDGRVRWEKVRVPAGVTVVRE